MTMNMDDNGGEMSQGKFGQKSDNFYDKLNKFDKRKNSENPSMVNSRMIKIDKTPSGQKSTKNFKFL
jgi:hypothetical protein